MATVHVDVVSAEQLLYSGEADFVVAPAFASRLPTSTSAASATLTRTSAVERDRANGTR